MSRETRKGKEFGKKTKAAAFKRANGHCEGCGQKLMPPRLQYDHDVPVGLGGDNSLENCRVLCSGSATSCHSVKTTQEDVPRMAKADAQKAAHLKLTPARKKIPQPARAPKKEGKKPLPPLQLYKKVS